MEQKDIANVYLRTIRICIMELDDVGEKLAKNKETEIVGAAIDALCTVINRSAIEMEDLFKEKKEKQ